MTGVPAGGAGAEALAIEAGAAMVMGELKESSNELHREDRKRSQRLEPNAYKFKLNGQLVLGRSLHRSAGHTRSASRPTAR